MNLPNIINKIRKLKALALAPAALVFSWVSPAWAVWTPLITTADFTGIRTDLLTAVAGIVGLFFIILGVGILYKVLR